VWNYRDGSVQTAQTKPFPCADHIGENALKSSDRNEVRRLAGRSLQPFLQANGVRWIRDSQQRIAARSNEQPVEPSATFRHERRATLPTVFQMGELGVGNELTLLTLTVAQDSVNVRVRTNEQDRCTSRQSTAKLPQ